MSKAGESILRGLREAVAHATGGDFKGRETRVLVPDNVDVAKIRKALKLSQTEFASQFGFKLSTLRDWEQKRRHPEAPARAFLTVIERDPEAVRRALG